MNIGRIHLSRDTEGREAFSLINIDSAPTASVLEGLHQLRGVLGVKHIVL